MPDTDPRLPDNDEPLIAPSGDDLLDPSSPVDADPNDPTVSETLEDGRLVWTDGAITDAEGNVLEEPQPESRESRVESRESTRTTEPSAPPAPTPNAQHPAPAAAPQTRQIYTAQGLKDYIFSEAALQEIADLRYSNPMEAERKSAELQERYQDGRERLRQHANALFNQELAELERVAPQTVRRFATEISRFKDTLSPEQLQQEGAARYVAAQVAAQAFTNDPLLMEEAVMRSLPGNGGVPPPSAPPKPRDSRPPTIIPREERVPGPGSARRDATRRRVPNANEDSLALHVKQTYGDDIDMDEARDYAAWLRKADKDRRS